MMKYKRCGECKNFTAHFMTTVCCDCEFMSNFEQKPPMTNGDRIRSMTDEELRDFLDKFRVETYTEPFGKKFCKCCPTVGTTEYKECEFVDGVCPHGDSLMWWLEQKVVT